MLTSDEFVPLSIKSIELGDTIVQALKMDGPGGKKVTRAEGQRIVRLCLELAVTIVRDVLD